MVALHKTLSCEVPSKGLAFCHRERFLWISINKSFPPLIMLRRMNMRGYMGVQKVNSPSLGRFQPLFTSIVVVQFFLKSLKGNTGLILDNEGL